jgi:hypothetical protein
MGPAAPPLSCPFCESENVELVSPWGGQIITSQMRCRACNTYFEAIRDEFAGARDDESEGTSSWTINSAGDR